MTPTFKDVYNKHKTAIDGYFKPEEINTTSKKVLSKLYPISLVLVFIFASVMALSYKLRGGLLSVKFKADKSVFLFFITYCTIVGYVWTRVLYNYDTSFPAWMYFPWSYSGIQFLQISLEDWIFYPLVQVVTFFVFCYFYYNTSVKDYKNRHFFELLTYFGFFLLTAWMCSVGRYFVWVTTVFIAAPVLVLWPYVRNMINLKQLHKFVCFEFLFAYVWDFVGVNLFSVVGRKLGWGLDFASGWGYVVPVSGQVLHSKVYIPYGSHWWAWIMNTPFEMIVFMPIAGALWSYVLALTVIRFKEQSNVV